MPKMNMRAVVRSMFFEKKKPRKVRVCRHIEKMKTIFLPWRSAILGRNIAEKAQPMNIEDPMKPMRA